MVAIGRGITTATLPDVWQAESPDLTTHITFHQTWLPWPASALRAHSQELAQPSRRSETVTLTCSASTA